MNNYSKKSLIFITLLFYQIIGYAAPPTKDVNVVNTPDVNVVSMPPVEVTVPGALDVNVQNTPTVNAQQSGPWVVEMQDNPYVTILNTNLNPVPVTTQSYPRSQFMRNANFTIGANQHSTTVEFYTVPFDKKLVIEHISCLIGMTWSSDATTGVRIYAQNTSNNIYFTQYLPIIAHQPSSGAFIGTERIKMYLDPDHKVLISATASTTGYSRSGSCSLAGYLVPVDSPSLAP